MPAFISLIKEEADGTLIANDQNTTKAAILRFVQKNAVLENRFRAKYKEVFSSRKKIANYACFWVPEYSFLSLSHSKKMEKSVKI